MKNTVINFFEGWWYIFGVAISLFVSLPLLSGFFTADPAVAALVNSVCLYSLFFFTAVHGVLCAEGLLWDKRSQLSGRCAGYCRSLLMLRVETAADGVALSI
jgi:hypothetical protein